MSIVHRLALRAYRRYQAWRGPADDVPVEERRRQRAALWRPGPVRGTLIEALEALDVVGEWVAAPVPLSGVTILWWHGGSFLYGSPQQRRGPLSRLSRSSRARVLAAGYRLAPEHPFPAALDDALAAYRWLLDAQVDPARLVVGGDSAGGGLAVSVLVSLRDAGDPLPAGAVLFSPWTDLSLGGDSMSRLSDVDDVLDAGTLGRAAAAYLGGIAPQHPLASPLFADLGRLPPMLIQSGGAELLLDDSVRLAASVRDGGGEAILDVWPGMPHVFQNLAPIIAEAGRALNQAGLFVRRVTGTM